MSQFWNERYGQTGFAYGEEPNVFFKTQLDALPTGRILLPAEGEGRNAVYAAQRGWDVWAFDQSVEGQKKALGLAQQRGVTIDYFVNTAQALPYQPGQFDVLGLIYAHFPAEVKSPFLQQLTTYLKPGGVVIFEAFSKKHLAYNSANPRIGGPKELGMLFSVEEIEADFWDFEVLYLREEEVELAEGAFHNGLGSVLRFVGVKKKLPTDGCFLNGQEYQYINNALEDESVRMRYFQLTKEIYGLEFGEWYQPDYWDNRFIPYLIMHGDIAVSSVAVCINDIRWQGKQQRYVQISTVMTLPAYRNKGLNRFLMEAVLNEWKGKCDAIYLLANDSVLNFYPKFGFEVFKEFQYSKPVVKSNGVYRRLDIKDHEDWNLIITKYTLGNPFSEVNVENKSQFIFHCIKSFSKDIYYIHEYDAVVIARFDNEVLTCYDVFAVGNFRLDDMLNALANESTKVAYLGFTPKFKEGYIIEESQEPDTHLFVLKGKENIFKDNKIMFPLLSRA